MYKGDTIAWHRNHDGSIPYDHTAASCSCVLGSRTLHTMRSKELVIFQPPLSDSSSQVLVCIVIARAAQCSEHLTRIETLQRPEKNQSKPIIPQALHLWRWSIVPAPCRDGSLASQPSFRHIADAQHERTHRTIQGRDNTCR